MKTKEQMERELADYAAQCNGTGQYYRYNPPSVLLTDGAKHFAETCEAFWLLDIIASWQLEPERIPDPDFQAWTLEKTAEGGARIFCGDGNETRKMMQEVEYTDFLPDSATLWCLPADETNRVIMIPAEY